MQQSSLWGEEINSRKKSFFETKRAENIGKPKELSKFLKKLALSNTSNTSKIILLRKTKLWCKNNCCFSKLPQFGWFPAKKLPQPTNKFNFESVKEYYNSFNVSSNFELKPLRKDEISQFIENTDVCKAATVV